MSRSFEGQLPKCLSSEIALTKLSIDYQLCRKLTMHQMCAQK